MVFENVFHISIIDTSLDETIYKKEVLGNVFTAGTGHELDISFANIPALRVVRDTNDSITIQRGSKTKQLTLPGLSHLPDGWTLLADKGSSDAIVLLSLKGPCRFTSIPREATPRKAISRNAIISRSFWPLFLIFILSLPFWVTDFNKSIIKNEDTGLPSITNALQNTLSPGPLHRAHQNSATQCNDCHQNEFGSIQIEPCLSCHTMKRHLTAAQTGNHPLCIGCHKEHEEPSKLIIRDERLCSQCHVNHDTLKGVLAAGIEVELDVLTNFPESHPEFNQEKNDSSNILFSHKAHLSSDKVKDKNNDKMLECVDCHRVSDRAKTFEPISMEADCGTCHGQGTKEASIILDTFEHGDLASILSLYQGVNIKHSLLNVYEVMNKQCKSCHILPTVAFNSTKELFAWKQGQSAGYARFSDLRFSHKRHEGSLKCLDCHSSASESKLASDSILPRKAQCSRCHQSESDDQAVLETRCADCHYFHTIDWD